MTRRLTACLALLLTAAVLLSGCGSGGKSKSSGSGSSSSSSGSLPAGVSVSGSFGSKPSITIKSPLKVTTSSTAVVIKGTGNPLLSGKQYLIHLTLADGRTGKTVISTYDKGYYALAGQSGDQSLFPALVTAMTGKKTGSRIVFTAKSDDAYGSTGSSQLGIKAGDPVVMVADLLGVTPVDPLSGPKGAAQKAPKNTPSVTVKSGKVTGIDFKSLPKVKKLTVITLVKGSGAVVKNPSLVTFNYYGAVWGRKKPFDESYTKTPTTFAVGIHNLITAWDKAIPGVTVGSRILILTPPGDGYGPKGSGSTIPKNATLAFVVDVLGAS